MGRKGRGTGEVQRRCTLRAISRDRQNVPFKQALDGDYCSLDQWAATQRSYTWAWIVATSIRWRVRHSAKDAIIQNVVSSVCGNPQSAAQLQRPVSCTKKMYCVQRTGFTPENCRHRNNSRAWHSKTLTEISDMQLFFNSGVSQRC